jgi:shikimate dehydrogenase
VTTLVALLGDPVEHSRSPAMQNAAFDALGLDWRYEAIAVEGERFDSVVEELRERGYAGANVTIPHKLRALEVASEATEVAKAVGAANTLVFAGEGILAHNTDVDGFLRALRERAQGAPAGMRALVLGAGGAARAVVHALAREEAAWIGVWNRHPDRARALVGDLGARGEEAPLEAVPEPAAAEADLLVNATSVGMAARKQSADWEGDFKQLHLPADKLDEVAVVVDMVYGHKGTALIREADARGSLCVDGFDVLAQQGAASFELWTGEQAPLEVMRREARKR